MTNFSSLDLKGPVGKPLVRVSGREKVTGTATFTAEWPMENVLHVVAVPATIPHGTVRNIDTSEAAKMAGVRLVITPENVPKFTRVPSGSETNFSTSVASSLFPAAEKEVFHAGQYLAGVVAESFTAARDAALQVKIDYETKSHVTDIDKAPADERPEKLMGAPPVITIGDAEQALQESEVVIDSDYPLIGNHHNPIEPHAAIAHWTTKNDKPFLTVYETSQSLSVAQASYAKVFGIDPKQVRVICKYVGGAFGSKGLMWPHALLACFAAKLTGQPCKCVVTRSQMYGGTGHRTPIRQRVAIGANKQGKIQSIIHDGYASTAIKDTYTEAFTAATRMMYHTDHLRLDQKQCRLHTQMPTFMRAPAETPGMFALESAIDELAVKLNIDPIELRRRNEPERDIHANKPFSSRLLLQCLDAGAKRFGWSERKREPRSQRDGNWLIGQGVAAATYPYFTFPTKARVTVHADGRVKIDCCSQEIGTGTRTAQSQLLADILDIPASRVSMELGDTALPKGGISGGSATSASVGGALRDAAEKLKSRLIGLVPADSALSGAKVEEVRFENGNLVSSKGSIAIEDLLSDAMKDSVSVSGELKASKDSSVSKHSFGATFVEVAVDEEFGLIRMRRMLGCYACGTILNAKTGRSQFIGGMIMGIGHALQEATHWDHRLGRITNDNLAEYHVPVNADIPDIDIMWIDTADYDASPIGAKGIGEISITGVAAAVANAVHHATGKRIRSLPLTPEKVIA
ncbi:oxidoreductase [Rhodopirellula maiorica SM1]|uniref:Oxidoreductase n=1 Tax=Rhodopirellula maiorica SM1 TaxID=1265738 RepID=M5RTP6_9BACT|nr:xanthine dehydrogenase family protein molybdopterin-binding subunit [Rhodopirellula maiorica]EMI18757.1 oxidoreductase [Rhodopirellula maiorica SM1]